MFESHFGLTSSPFGLNPDPDFYFPSKGHGHALSYLRYGVHQGEGFVVVTGEIGAGKTTLVRTLLSELDDSRIVAAQIVSTQLDAGDLLRSVAIAFGMPGRDASKAELIASIEAFLTMLVTQERRALLVIDEAQNLDLRAIEELRMLSNFQLGNRALLQSFLVGQPELRAMLTSKPMEQFRQRVIASCHLGPMGLEETRAYVQFRLERAGWSGRPAFEIEAFDRIQEWTEGVPRRVNLLCSRLMLSAYLTTVDTIDAEMVDRVAQEARAEVRSFTSVPSAPERQVAGGRELPAARTVPLQPAPSALRDGPGTADGPLMCVAATQGDDLRMAMLLRSLKSRESAPRMVMVRIGDASLYERNDDFLGCVGLDVPTIEIDLPDGVGEGCAMVAAVMERFERLVELHRPAMLVVAGEGDAALACALVAAKKATPLTHVDSSGSGLPSVNQRLIDGMAQLHFVADDRRGGLLSAAGFVDESVILAGDLLGEAARLAAHAGVSPSQAVPSLKASVCEQLSRHGYCLVRFEHALPDQAALTELVGLARQLSAQIPLLWPMDASWSERVDALGLRKLLRNDRIVLLPVPDYGAAVSLLAGASCLLTDSPDALVEAEALSVPSVVLDGRDWPHRSSAHTAMLIEDMRRRASVGRSGWDTATLPGPASSAEGVPSERIADRLFGLVAAAA